MLRRQWTFLRALGGPGVRDLTKKPKSGIGLQLVTSALARFTDLRGQDDVIDLSLELSGLDGVPDDLQELAALIGGPLFEAAELRLGESEALQLIRVLAPTLRMVDPRQTLEPKTRCSDRPTQWSSFRVAIVDRDGEMRSVIGQALSAMGHEVLMSVDGHEALMLYRRRRPDLIICEVDLLTISGPVLAWLAAMHFGANSPKIILWTDTGKACRRPDNVVHQLARPRLDILFRAVASLAAQHERRRQARLSGWCQKTESPEESLREIQGGSQVVPKMEEPSSQAPALHPDRAVGDGDG